MSKLSPYHHIEDKYIQIEFHLSKCLLFPVFFKIPALKTLDPELIHVEIIYDNNGKCGKSYYFLSFKH